MEEEFRFGLHQRIYNWNMRVARQDRGWTQGDLAEQCGLSKQTIGHIECLRQFPKPAQAEKIALALGHTTKVLFPEWLKEFQPPRRKLAAEERSCTLVEAIETRRSYPALVAGEGWEEEVEKQVGLEADMKKALTRLGDRERRVIVLRFGFEGEPKTLDDVAAVLGVTRERIRQIEHKALMTLRHPRISKTLVDYLD